MDGIVKNFDIFAIIKLVGTYTFSSDGYSLEFGKEIKFILDCLGIDHPLQLINLNFRAPPSPLRLGTTYGLLKRILGCPKKYSVIVCT